MTTENLQATPGEAKYVEWDEEVELFGVFGEDSGFCYGTFFDEDSAEDYCQMLMERHKEPKRSTD